MNDLPMSPDATLIVPQRNQAELTLRCLSLLREFENVCWPIIVVDDGSDAAERERVGEQELSGVTLLTQEPRGVTAAWNLGGTAAATEWLIFLNNDALCRGEFVRRLLEPLRQGRLMSGVQWRRETAVATAAQRDWPTRRFLEGWCFAVRREHWAELSGFDETLSLYFSDTDFQLRLLTLWGRDETALAALPDLPLIHLGHRTARQLSARRHLWRRDRNAFREKWAA